MTCEITVKIRDSQKTMTEKTVIYNESVIADMTDVTVDRLIAKATKNFGESKFATKVTVTIKLLDD